jgi:hypothetical protein
MLHGMPPVQDIRATYACEPAASILLVHSAYQPLVREYLKYSFPARVDGLMFGSSQGPGANVVVFYGPEFCSDKESEDEFTRLSLDPASVRKHRVTTVIRRPTQP